MHFSLFEEICCVKFTTFSFLIIFSREGQTKTGQIFETQFSRGKLQPRQIKPGASCAGQITTTKVVQYIIQCVTMYWAEESELPGSICCSIRIPHFTLHLLHLQLYTCLRSTDSIKNVAFSHLLIKYKDKRHYKQLHLIFVHGIQDKP